jgi:hypothetical protein
MNPGAAPSGFPAGTGAQINTPYPGLPGAVWDDPTPIAPAQSYLLEVHAPEPGAELLATITEYVDGFWTEYANAPNELAFSYPKRGTNAALLMHPNEIWLYRDEPGTEGSILIDKFRIKTLEDVRDGATLTTKFVWENRLASLIDDVVKGVDSANEPESLAVFGRRCIDRSTLHWGGVDQALPAVDIQLRITKPTTVLAATQQAIRQASGSRALVRWSPHTDSVQIVSTGDDIPRQTIQYGFNLDTLLRRKDFTKIATALLVSGEGHDRQNAVSLDGGPDEPLLDETAAGVYGTRCKMWRDPSIVDADALEAAATRQLAERSSPEESFTVKVYDLFATDPEFVAEWMLDLHPGRATGLLDTDLGVEATVYIQSIRHALADPLDITVELDKRPPSATGTIADLAAAIDEAATGTFDVANNDGRRYPNVSRMFHGETLAAVEALPVSNPGLVFRDGDYAQLAVDPTARLRHYEAGEWKPIGDIHNIGMQQFTIFEVDEFPAIPVGMPFTLIRIREEGGIGWTMWHAIGESEEGAGDGDPCWAQTRWTNLTGAPGDLVLGQNTLYNVNGNGDLVVGPPGLLYGYSTGNWVAEVVA